MADNMEQLKTLRQATGARMLDCQKALKECNGNMDEAMAWLRKNVHALGSLVSTREMLTRATGRPLDAAIFKAHLKARYLDS